MRELSYIISALGVIVIAIAALVWVGWYKSTDSYRGSAKGLRSTEVSAGLYLGGATICAVAMIVAVVGRLQR